ncbi:MAG: lysyl oxidase family protein [Gemmataceae bacterium]
MSRRTTSCGNSLRKYRRSRLSVTQLEVRINPAGPMLPNLQIYQPDMPTGTVTVNSNHEIRFTTSLTNAGMGAFDLRADGAVINNADGTQSIVTNQRIYNDDNNNGKYDPYNASTNPTGDKTYNEQLAGTFSYHPTHGHMHFNEFAIARLRIRGPGNSLGDVVAVGPKTSFCLEDLGQPYPTLPGSPTSAVYFCAASYEGISVGWKDVYSSGLDGQFINVMNIPNGDYWLEIEADYANHVQETNETDNISRSMITISNQPATGFLVLSSTPTGGQSTPQSYVDFFFNQAVDSTTFTPAAVSMTGPPGQTNIPITSITMISSVQFRANFASQSSIGTYNITLNPALIKNTAGQKLDQNNNTVGGEVGDSFTSIFTITAPSITSASPAGTTAAPVSSVRLTYNRPMVSSTFTVADIVSFTGPGGTNLLSSITNVSPVTAGGLSTQFDVLFSPVSNPGAYVLVIGSNIQDTYGNLVDQNNNGIPNEPADSYTNAFTIPVAGTYGPDAFGYTAKATTYQYVAMTGAAGITYTNTDDESRALNLGTDTFNFYGTSYTGNTSVFASTNALISFGAADSSYNNDLGLPTLAEPVIAALWDDWIIGSATPQVQYLIRDTNGDLINDQLVIEWNQIRHYSTTTGGISFQAVLELNTGNRPGKIVFNYQDLSQGIAQFDNSASATVGLRSNPAMNSTLAVSVDSNNHPLIGDGKAILLSVPSVASITRLDPNPADDGQMHFQVNFSDGVTGVDPTDFTVTSTGGISGAGIAGVVATADPKVWQVIVDSGIGSGTLKVNLIDNDSIISIAGAKLGGAGLINGDYKSSEVYTVVQQAPEVFHLAYGTGAAQRSRVYQIQVAFDHPVTFLNPSNPETAFQVVGPNGPVTVAVNPNLGDAEQTVCMLTFSGTSTEFGSLKDGKYTLTILANQVNTAGVAFDGNGDGVGGDNYVTHFHRLFGDSNGDGAVDQMDYLAFRDTVGGGPNDAFDFQQNGDVNQADYLEFRNRIGMAI